MIRNCNALISVRRNAFVTKNQWCEALSLKSARPYYVDFFVLEWSRKVSKLINSEKFSKKNWILRVVAWGEACFEKQSYMRSSDCMLRDFWTCSRNQLKNMISNFSSWRKFQFFPEFQFRQTAMVRFIGNWRCARFLQRCIECPDASMRQCTEARITASMRQGVHKWFEIAMRSSAYAAMHSSPKN